MSEGGDSLTQSAESGEKFNIFNIFNLFRCFDGVFLPPLPPFDVSSNPAQIVDVECSNAGQKKERKNIEKC